MSRRAGAMQNSDYGKSPHLQCVFTQGPDHLTVKGLNWDYEGVMITKQDESQFC